MHYAVQYYVWPVGIDGLFRAAPIGLQYHEGFRTVLEVALDHMG